MILKYLRYTLEYELHYINYPVLLEGYNDVNWKFDINDSNSTSKYVFKLGKAIVFWKSFKHCKMHNEIIVYCSW